MPSIQNKPAPSHSLPTEGGQAEPLDPRRRQGQQASGQSRGGAGKEQQAQGRGGQTDAQQRASGSRGRSSSRSSAASSSASSSRSQSTDASSVSSLSLGTPAEAALETIDDWLVAAKQGSAIGPQKPAILHALKTLQSLGDSKQQVTGFDQVLAALGKLGDGLPAAEFARQFLYQQTEQRLAAMEHSVAMAEAISPEQRASLALLQKLKNAPDHKARLARLEAKFQGVQPGNAAPPGQTPPLLRNQLWARQHGVTYVVKEGASDLAMGAGAALTGAQPVSLLRIGTQNPATLGAVTGALGPTIISGGQAKGKALVLRTDQGGSQQLMQLFARQIHFDKRYDGAKQRLQGSEYRYVKSTRSATWEQQQEALAAANSSLLPQATFVDQKGRLYEAIRRYDTDVESLTRNTPALRQNRAFLLRMLSSALGTLDRLHEAGWMHLDIKPENILVDLQSEQVALGDFGLVSKEHQLQQIQGTYRYLPPEMYNQGSGDLSHVQRSADLFSLALTAAYVAAPEALAASPLSLLKPNQLADDKERHTRATKVARKVVPGFKRMQPQEQAAQVQQMLVRLHRDDVEYEYEEWMQRRQALAQGGGGVPPARPSAKAFDRLFAELSAIDPVIADFVVRGLHPVPEQRQNAGYWRLALLNQQLDVGRQEGQKLSELFADAAADNKQAGRLASSLAEVSAVMQQVVQQESAQPTAAAASVKLPVKEPT